MGSAWSLTRGEEKKVTKFRGPQPLLDLCENLTHTKTRPRENGKYWEDCSHQQGSGGSWPATQFGIPGTIMRPILCISHCLNGQDLRQQIRLQPTAVGMACSPGKPFVSGIGYPHVCSAHHHSRSLEGGIATRYLDTCAPQRKLYQTYMCVSWPVLLDDLL